MEQQGDIMDRGKGSLVLSHNPTLVGNSIIINKSKPGVPPGGVVPTTTISFCCIKRSSPNYFWLLFLCLSYLIFIMVGKHFGLCFFHSSALII